MNQEELEEWYIRSLDVPVSADDKEKFLEGLQRYPELAKRLALHKEVREALLLKKPASFGPYFVTKLMYQIENTGIVIDHQIFSFFRKFQLAALGTIVGLIILNVMLADNASLTSIFGIDRVVTTSTEETEVPFDFFETLNNDL